MAHKFSELEAKMSPEAIARSDARYRQMIAEMPWHELRRARGLSQEMLAKRLRVMYLRQSRRLVKPWTAQSGCKPLAT